jgi:hypothetical protein
MQAYLSILYFHSQPVLHAQTMPLRLLPCLIAQIIIIGMMSTGVNIPGKVGGHQGTRMREVSLSCQPEDHISLHAGPSCPLACRVYGQDKFAEVSSLTNNSSYHWRLPPCPG